MGNNGRRLWWIQLLLVVIVASAGSNDNVHSMVYRGCSDAEYTQGSAYENNLNAFLEYVISEAPPTAYFYNRSVGEGGADAVYGLFQCRGDLSNADCLKCRSRIVAQAPSLCGNTVGARVQLQGCYLRYENAKFFGAPDQHLVYKACSAETTADPAFLYHRDSVLEGLDKGSFSSNDFRVTSSGESKEGPPVYGYAQCEGDLSWPECADCVQAATVDVKQICGSSVAGQVYLQKCYVSYALQDGGHPSHDTEGNHVTAKTVAIAVGGCAAAIFAFIFLLFLKSLCKSDDD